MSSNCPCEPMSVAAANNNRRGHGQWRHHCSGQSLALLNWSGRGSAAADRLHLEKPRTTLPFFIHTCCTTYLVQRASCALCYMELIHKPPACQHSTDSFCGWPHTNMVADQAPCCSLLGLRSTLRLILADHMCRKLQRMRPDRVLPGRSCCRSCDCLFWHAPTCKHELAVCSAAGSPSIAADACSLHVEAQLSEALHHLHQGPWPVGTVHCNDGAVVIGFVVNRHLHSG